jgi:hypothetical protein
MNKIEIPKDILSERKNEVDECQDAIHPFDELDKSEQRECLERASRFASMGTCFMCSAIASSKKMSWFNEDSRKSHLMLHCYSQGEKE